MSICPVCEMSVFYQYANSRYFTSMRTVGILPVCEQSVFYEYANSQYFTSRRNVSILTVCEQSVFYQYANSQHSENIRTTLLPKCIHVCFQAPSMLSSMKRATSATYTMKVLVVVDPADYSK